MGKRMIAGLAIGALAVVLAWGGISMTRPEPVNAQRASGFEYGFLLPVPRLESYDIDLGRWAAKPTDKEYHNALVFPYEEGSNTFERRVNCLRRLNGLSADGWELVDAEAGLLRRAK
ncbi:MAG: hypothetical protein IT464_05605 [Planctomycetes bacterium]|nr:hypothetical protein [Planctomycetota bacterium]